MGLRPRILRTPPVRSWVAKSDYGLFRFQTTRRRTKLYDLSTMQRTNISVTSPEREKRNVYTNCPQLT